MQEREGKWAEDPVTATLHLHFPLPLLAGPIPVGSVPCKAPTFLALFHVPQTLISPLAIRPSVISSLSKTAQLLYLSVTILLFGNLELWGWG